MTHSRTFHVMCKPRGAVCNLDCAYCYYLPKAALYPESDCRMSGTLLEEYIRQYMDAQPGPEITFGWQGGEPTLMGLDFFQRAVELQKKHALPGIRVLNTLQTNGTTLDDDWCTFFRSNDFLVGISLDGPRACHDAFRVDKGGAGTFERVMRGIELLKKHRVDYNILTTVNSANVGQPLSIYRFVRDEVGAAFIQFIPIVERSGPDGPETGVTSARSISGKRYAEFLTAIFDEWVRRDVGRIFVQLFDVALGVWMGQPAALCVFAETCGGALAMEHNGDLYACDHFVEPDYRLGNVQQQGLEALAGSERQSHFGLNKRNLPRYCLACPVHFICYGGCPKDRLLTTPDGEPGLNVLCEGFRAFFTHIDRPMRIMASLLREQRPPAEIMLVLAREETELAAKLARAARNEACPCGSGNKFKYCHGARQKRPSGQKAAAAHPAD